MGSKHTAVIKRENEWWIGWIEEVPGVNCQERTKEELLSSLKQTLSEAIEFNKRGALTACRSGAPGCRQNIVTSPPSIPPLHTCGEGDRGGEVPAIHLSGAQGN